MPAWLPGPLIPALAPSFQGLSGPQGRGGGRVSDENRAYRAGVPSRERRSRKPPPKDKKLIRQAPYAAGKPRVPSGPKGEAVDLSFAHVSYCNRPSRVMASASLPPSKSRGTSLATSGPEARTERVLGNVVHKL